jgi:hypothetical protein
VSRLGRYVGRARGGALRAVGAPRTPNLPSGRAVARRAVAGIVPAGQPGRPARRTASGGSGTGGGCRPVQRGTGVTTTLLLVAALAFVIYLLAYDAPVPAGRPPATTCHDKVVYEHTRLQDC